MIFALVLGIIFGLVVVCLFAWYRIVSPSEAHLVVTPRDKFVVSSDDLIKTVKKLIHEGNVRRIIIKDEKGKMLLDIPVTIGVVGAIIAPWLAALGVIGAIATNCTIVVERRK